MSKFIVVFFQGRGPTGIKLLPQTHFFLFILSFEITSGSDVFG